MLKTSLLVIIILLCCCVSNLGWADKGGHPRHGNEPFNAFSGHKPHKNHKKPLINTNAPFPSSLIDTNTKHPPGWDHGKKTGWHSESTPPGLTKRDDSSQSILNKVTQWFKLK